MNNKAKGILQILLVVILIAAFAFVAYAGIGDGHKGSAKNIRLGLDLQGGVSVTYQVKNNENPKKQDMEDTIYKMQKRVEDFSTEASVYQEGSNRITIDIPGVSNSQEILQKLGKAGALYFILYTDLQSAEASGGAISEGDQVTFDKKKIVLDGSMIKEAAATTQQKDSTGKTENVVSLEFNGKGTKKFASFTAEHKGDQFAIVYDDKMISNPVINEEITGGKCIISGGDFEDFENCKELASTLRIGALPLELENIHDNVVGATLGSEALSTSLIAGLIGFILVMIFMIIMYRIPGLAADIALIFYIGAMLIILNVLNVTLTLPGIAGIILSVGMAVDANCIIFTRIREELTTGKTVASSIKNGHQKALSAIIDGNVTTLIAAFVLYLRGSGTVKGFATTLAIGILLSMITAIFVTRIVLEAFASLGVTNIKFYGTVKEREAIKFVENWKKYVCISGSVFVICIVGLIVNANTKGSILNYSLDFIGGTSTSVSVEKVENDAKDKAINAIKEATGVEGEASTTADNGVNKITVRTTALTEEQEGKAKKTLAKAFGVSEDKIEYETISASVSSEMQQDAVIATIIAAICMLIYIWIRFRKLSTGISAVLALIHDVIVVFTVYVIGSSFIQVGSTFIAVMLTIVGYSINDTIVIFDRIRENRHKAGPKTTLAEVINKSITETLSRSINTSFTTFIMVFILALLGVASIKQFAIPMIIGIISGCYSSICIAAPLWYALSGKDKKVSKAKTYSKKK